MLTLQERATIFQLIDNGSSFSEISQRVGTSLMTIYRLKKSKNRVITDKSRSLYRKLDSFIRQHLGSRFKQGVTNASKLYRELKQQGHSISYGTINRYIKDLKIKTIKHRSDIPSIHVETPPGKQVQVDWGTFGKIEVSGRMKQLLGFIFVLGYSRMIYVEFTVRQNLQALENCHIHAFDSLGIPQSIVYDNMKTVVLRREKLLDGSFKRHYNPAFLDFAQHYGFRVVACWPYWPRGKGKVESAVKFVRNDFMQGMKFGRDFHSLGELNNKVKHWLNTFANVRVHRATGKRPIDLFEEERQLLHFPQNLPRYETSSVIERNSTKDGLIQYKLNFYSIPIQYARRKLYIKEVSENDEEFIDIYFEDKPIARHILSHERGRWVVNDTHLEPARKPPKERAEYADEYKSTELPREDFSRPLDYYKNLIPDSSNE